MVEDNKIEMKKFDNTNSKEMRELAATGAKSYKQAWIQLGIVLSGIFENKTFEYWGWEKFEHYTIKELGLKRSVAMNIVKNYQFVLDWQPELLEPKFLETCTAETYPDFDSMGFLRKVKNNKHINKDEYEDVRKRIIDKKEPMAEVRKDIALVIKERKEEDGDISRDKRQQKAVRKFKAHLEEFKKESDVLKLLTPTLSAKIKDIMEDIDKLDIKDEDDNQ